MATSNNLPKIQDRHYHAHLRRVASLITCLLAWVSTSGQADLDSSVVRRLDSMTDLSVSLNQQFRYDSSYNLVRYALGIAGSALPDTHRTCINLLRQQGRTCQLSGRLAEADSLYRMALARYEQRGDRYLRTAGLTMNNLGTVLVARQQYAEAERVLLEAQRIFDVCPDEPPVWTSFPLINLGELYYKTRQYFKAVTPMEECIALREAISGFDDLALGNNYALLADCYSNLGEFAKAEKARVRILQLLLRGDTTLDLRHCWRLNNIAMTHLLMENFSAAASYFQEALDCKRQMLPPFDPDLGRTLMNYGNASGSAGQFAKADSLYRAALAIFRQDSQRLAMDMAWALNNIGWINTDLRPDTARYYLIQSLRVKSQHLDTADVDFLLTLTNLAHIEIRLRQAQAAGKILRIIERHHPVRKPGHDMVRLEYYSLRAESALMRGDLSEALACYDTLLREDMAYIGQIARQFSSFSLDHQLEQSRKLMDCSISCLSELSSPTDQQIEKVLEWRHFYHGLVRTQAERIRDKRSAQRIPQELLDDIRFHEFLIEEAHLRAPAERFKIDSLQASHHALLARLVELTGIDAKSVESDDSIDPASGLSANDALLEIIRFDVYHPSLKDSVGYGALVTYGDGRKPRFVQLFTESTEDPLITGLTPARYARTVPLYTAEDNKGKAPHPFEIVWHELEPHLSGIHRLFVLPDGVFHLVNMAALPLGTGRLGDKIEIVRVTRPKVVETSPGGSNDLTFVLLGNIQFDADSSQMATLAVAKDTQATIPPHETNAYLALRGGPWQPLAGASLEIDRITKLLASAGKRFTVLGGPSATEERLAQLQHGPDRASPDVLHIASHGYFFPDPKREPRSLSDNRPGSAYRMSDHPMLRSGLILAGGNFAWQRGLSVDPTREDGVLTAYEVSLMNLSDTKLVVLSACETGLGEIRAAEGVYGLQRAFKIAGVRNIIMSLWKVPDAATAELMTSFYRYWVTDHMPIREALNQAQQDLRDQGLDPYYWAAWVLVE